MQEVSFYLDKFNKLGARKVANKVFKKFVSFFYVKSLKTYDLNLRRKIIISNRDLKFRSILDLKQFKKENYPQTKEEIQFLTNNFLNHRFDLLGSGWSNLNKSNKDKNEFENLKDFQIIQGLIDSNYFSINWNLDFKFGHFWKKNIWYKDARANIPEGADLKVPWELSRFQHMPFLAFSSYFYPEFLHDNINEFKNEVLDFILSNPVRFGVNWNCAMDVGIRAANLLISYDIFSQLNPESFDDKFNNIFFNYMYDHAIHIMNNLEGSGDETSNHYLGDVAGVLFISLYISGDKKLENYFSFASSAVFEEFEKQFLEDGGNFEASTCYHRLSLEIITLCLCFIGAGNVLANREQDFIRISKKLYKSYCFFKSSFTCKEELVQFGDNDSGRMLKPFYEGEFLSSSSSKYINPSGESFTFDENILKSTFLLDLLPHFFGDSNKDSFSKDFFSSLHFKYSFDKNYASVPFGSVQNSEKVDYKKLPFSRSKVIIFKDYGLSDLKFKIDGKFEKFGLYTWRASNSSVHLFLGPNGQRGNGGHCHNSKLAAEIIINGMNVIREPGTYIYTPAPQKRNLYRSTQARYLPIFSEGEQNSFVNLEKSGLFTLKNECNYKLINFTDDRFLGMIKFREVVLYREILICNNFLEIIDYSNREFHYSDPLNRSNGYGKIMKEVCF